jgi:hypothetical protein
MKLISFFKLLSFLGLFTLLFSCSKSIENRELNEYLSSYVQSNDKVIFFGSVDIMQILEKAEYESIPKFGIVASSYISELQSGLDLNKGIFYAIHGPMAKDGAPEELVCFFYVKDLDSLKMKISQQGFDLEEGKDFSYFRDNDVSMAIQGNMAVLLVKNGNFDEKEILAVILDQSRKEIDEKQLLSLSKKVGDINLIAHMGHLYSTSNTELEKLDEAKKKEILALVTDSYSQSTLFFEAGQMRLKTTHFFNENLRKRNFMRQDAKAGVMKKLGAGSPSLALSLNMDIRQLQAFVEDFSPASLDEMAANIGGPFQMMMMMAGGKVSNLIDGEIGFAMFGESKPDIGVTPDFTFYAGFGPNGKSLAEMAQNNMGGDMRLQVDSKGVYGASSEDFEYKNGQSISVPMGCEKFGKGALTAYANFEKMDMASFELEGAAKMLTLAKYLTIYFDKDGGEVILKTKNEKVNILKQAAQFLLEEFSSQIGGMAI